MRGGAAPTENAGKISFRLFLRRSAAYLVDILVLFVVLAPAGSLVEWLLGYTPRTGQEIWTAILLNFSLPVWLYFVLSDRSAGGATLGKWLLQLRVTDRAGGRLGGWWALLRTAVKLLPWELAHLSAFALVTDPARWTLLQWGVLAAAYVLMAVYLLLAVLTRGRRSVHDYVAGSELRFTPRTRVERSSA